MQQNLKGVLLILDYKPVAAICQQAPSQLDSGVQNIPFGLQHELPHVAAGACVCGDAFPALQQLHLVLC